MDPVDTVDVSAPASRPGALAWPVVPFAVGLRSPVRPDLVPLDRPVPDHVDDPGPATVLRHDAGTAILTAAKRRRVADDPAPWTAADHRDPARLARAGRELARALAARHPDLLRADDEAVRIVSVGVDVRDDDRVDLPANADGTARLVAARIERVPAPRRWLEAVALAVGEDLVLVDDGARAVWLHVAAPSGWDPGAAAGADLSALHGPVPHADRLRAASRALGRAIVGSGPHVRWTWGLTATPDLAQHARLRRAGTPPAVGALTFRAERQTTLPLPEARLGLFAIRVHRAPLARVVDSPSRAEALAAAVAALPAELAAYKGIAGRRDELLRWLERAPVAGRQGRVAPSGSSSRSPSTVR